VLKNAAENVQEKRVFPYSGNLTVERGKTKLKLNGTGILTLSVFPDYFFGAY